jgi:hypothetical protein
MQTDPQHRHAQYIQDTETDPHTQSHKTHTHAPQHTDTFSPPQSIGTV